MASLVPSLTELVVALGLRDRLVARTGYCIHPAEALAGVPKVGGTKDVNLAKLRRLAPTHVLVNIDENRSETVDALREFVPNVVVTHPCDPQDNLALVEQMRAAFAGEPQVDARATALREALEFELSAAAAPAGETVLYLIWHDPWMTVARDTYISRMLARIGWHTVPATTGGPSGAARYPALRGDEPWLADVQRVLLSSEPFAFDEHHAQAAQLLCPQARVQRVDGELLSWYGARAVAGLRYLRRLAQS
ncbi:MAG TPA: helical backbone metal receptor [Burkholderiaceae bacterium]|nr:helical backbone metal receptor [Burkholderiaceae bacterium]